MFRRRALRTNEMTGKGSFIVPHITKKERREERKERKKGEEVEEHGGDGNCTPSLPRPRFLQLDSGRHEGEREGEEQLIVEGRARGGREEGREAPPLPPPPRSFICGGHKISRD